jgi:hypothetical protein
MTPDEVEQLKPCPCCGAEYPWTVITYACAVLRCTCGLEMEHGSVRITYPEAEIPHDLREHAYPARCLGIRQKDESVLNWPEHGLWGINIPAAFAHAGLTAKWNRRTP